VRKHVLLHNDRLSKESAFMEPTSLKVALVIGAWQTPILAIQDRLNAFSTDRLTGIRRGVEKESLRVRRAGSLSVTPDRWRWARP
jgi:hypothetical protein